MLKFLVFPLAVLVCLFGFCYSYPNEFTFYTGYNNTGNSTIVRSKIADLSTVSPNITLNHRSICYRGYWRSYSGRNFTGNYSGGFGNIDYNFCYNQSLYTGSIRYLGPANTNNQSMSLYSGPNLTGTELVIDGLLYGNISFTPRSLFTTARSNWTVYSGPNFNGTALCFISNNNFHNMETLNSTIAANIKSVVRGCNGKFEAFVQAKDFYA